MSLASEAIALVTKILTQMSIKGQTGIKSIPNAREIQNKAIDIVAEMRSKGYDLARDFTPANIKLYINSIKDKGVASLMKVKDQMSKVEKASDDLGKTLGKNKSILDDVFENMFGGFTPKVVPKSLSPEKIKRIKDGISTKIKLNRGEENKKYAKELMTNSDEFRQLPDADRKELLDLIEESIKDSGDDVFPFNTGGRVGMGAGGLIGKFTKAEVLIEMIKNTLKTSKDLYVKKNFPTFLKELRQNPELANDPNVWKQFTTGLPKNQRLVVHSDDSVDFFRQTEFGPQNIKTITAFQKKYPFLSREEATKITKMEPEDQVLEVTRLERIYDKNLKQKNIDRIQRLRDQGFFDKALGGRVGFKNGKGVASLEEEYYGKQKLDWLKNFSDQMTFEEYLQMMSMKAAKGGRVSLKGGGVGHPPSSNSMFENIFYNPNHPYLSTFNTMGIMDMIQQIPFFNKGGRVGFKKGKGLTRRTFLKLMGGLAALPVVGKFLGPATKVAEKAIPAAQEGFKIGKDNFLLLVDKIKRFGKKTDGLATKEREVGYVYSDKKGNTYELIEDISSGDKRIIKDRPGVGQYGEETFDTIEDRTVMELKKGEYVKNKKGKIIKTKDEYFENQEVAGVDGTFDDVADVADDVAQEVIEEVGGAAIKKKSGGLATMFRKKNV